MTIKDLMYMLSLLPPEMPVYVAEMSGVERYKLIVKPAEQALLQVVNEKLIISNDIPLLGERPVEWAKWNSDKS